MDMWCLLCWVGDLTIRNTHAHDEHSLHTHTNPFQVAEIRGQPQADRMWRDTVVVPRPAKGGSTVIRTRFLDYTGVFMMHYHMMNHEELGMMQAVEVYKGPPPTSSPRAQPAQGPRSPAAFSRPQAA